MAFPNYITGDILYVTGTADNLLGEEAAAIMPACNLITVVTITGFVYIKPSGVFFTNYIV